MKLSFKNNVFRLFAAILLLIPCFFAFFGCSLQAQTSTQISISSDGYWVINGTKTDTKAEGKDGEDAQQISLKAVYDELVETENYEKSFSEFLKEYLGDYVDLTYNISDHCKTSVVSIIAQKTKIVNQAEKTTTKNGSGVVFQKDGSGNAFVITNHHVCYTNYGLADTINLYLAGDDNFENAISASIVAADDAVDLAILKVENNATINNAGVASLASSNAKAGTSCLAIGNAYSKGIAITLGNVSKQIENLYYDAGLGNRTREVLRHCAFIAKGNSGGGLFNLAGELIGIPCAGEGNDTTLMNYAIPIEIVNNYISQVINN